MWLDLSSKAIECVILAISLGNHWHHLVVGSNYTTSERRIRTTTAGSTYGPTSDMEEL
jgi:hypothetical protein